MEIRGRREAQAPRSSNAAVLAFYERLGYARDEAISLGKRPISDEQGIIDR